MSPDAASPTLEIKKAQPNIYRAEADPAPVPAEPKKSRPHQFKPGQRLKDSQGRQYWVDQHCSLRRAEGGKLSKAEKKAEKRRRMAR
ncbi:MAG: hypothetical protein M1438_09260 [Deltaproteobacteria bacterium]|nr:hypothetical protein [Deltaproteobacteria bacterium]